MRIIVEILILLVLNIPVSLLFHKAGLKLTHAFIPFLNVFEYIHLVGFKKKYLISILMIILSFGLCWDMFKGYGLFASGMYKGLGVRVMLLLAIPTCMYLRLAFLLVSSFTLFMCLLRAGNHCFLHGQATPRVFFGSMAMIVFLFFFYAKLAYKTALKFGRSEKKAFLHVIFQPITIWILGCGGSKYEDDHNEESSLSKLEKEYTYLKENKFNSPIAEDKLSELSASDFYSVDEKNNQQTQTTNGYVQPNPMNQQVPINQQTISNQVGVGNQASMPQQGAMPQQGFLQAQGAMQTQPIQPTLSQEIQPPQKTKEEIEKHQNAFFRKAMWSIIGILFLLWLIRFIPRYYVTHNQVKEQLAVINQETEAKVEKLKAGDHECKTPDIRSWSAYIRTKLPENVDSRGDSSYLFTGQNSDICYEYYDLSYTEKTDGKEGVSVGIYGIENFKTKEVLFKCIQRDGKITELTAKGKKGDLKKSCSELLGKAHSYYKNGFDAYGEDGNLKDYDDFDDRKLSKQLKQLNLEITTNCEKIFRTKGNMSTHDYYYLSGENELLFIGEMGYQLENCGKYNEYIYNAIIGNI